jgi:hypothetical protein
VDRQKACHELPGAVGGLNQAAQRVIIAGRSGLSGISFQPTENPKVARPIASSFAERLTSSTEAVLARSRSTLSCDEITNSVM